MRKQICLELSINMTIIIHQLYSLNSNASDKHSFVPTLNRIKVKSSKKQILRLVYLKVCFLKILLCIVKQFSHD